MGLLINLTSSGRTHEACAGLAESSHLTGRGHRPSFLKRSSASLDRMTQVNTDAFGMRICCAKWRQRPTRSRVFIGRISGSDPNGIRTRVTAVKGRCPGPLDDRVVKARAISNCYSWTQGKLPDAPDDRSARLSEASDQRRSARG